VQRALAIEGPLTTRQIARRLQAKSPLIYGICRKLETKGVLSSRLGKWGERSGFFFPMLLVVMTNQNHHLINELTDQLRNVVGRYELPEERAALVAALERELAVIRARPDMTHHAEALSEFETELIAAAWSAAKRSEVTRLLGIRPMQREERLWTLLQEAFPMPV
jgi:hypothetical protein